MAIFLSIFWLIVGGVLLYYGAEWLISGGVAIARRAGVSMLVIGLTLVAFATSAPELVVSLQAAGSGLGDVSIGNIVGSNICNILLILGVSAALHPVNVNRQILHFDMPVLILSTLVFALFGVWLGQFNRLTGLLFFCGILGYTFWNIHAARKNPESISGESSSEEEDSAASEKSLWLSIGLVVLGAVALAAGGKAFVRGAIDIGHFLHVSEAVIALTVVALGTSLPELATSAIAACRGESDIALGNVVGSNIFNILCIIGVTPMIFPIQTSGIVLYDWLFMLASSVVLLPILFTGKKITRGEGWLMLALYGAYVAYLAMR